MAERLWAPWRMQYIRQHKQTTECVLCEYPKQECSRSTGLLLQSSSVYVVLNKFPYAAGHLMVVPARHVSDLGELPVDVFDRLWRVVRDASAALRRALGAQGLNIGVNLGSAAGAGIDAHLHVHLVPRWAGDHNFMAVIGDTRVINEYLEETWAKLAPEFAELGSQLA